MANRCPSEDEEIPWPHADEQRQTVVEVDEHPVRRLERVGAEVSLGDVVELVDGHALRTVPHRGDAQVRAVRHEGREELRVEVLHPRPVPAERGEGVGEVAPRVHLDEEVLDADARQVGLDDAPELAHVSGLVDGVALVQLQLAVDDRGERVAPQATSEIGRGSPGAAGGGPPRPASSRGR